MRKIVAFTGARSEYGVILNTLKLLRPKCDLNIIASGAHLSEAHGMTVREIESDGFTPIRTNADLRGDSHQDIAIFMGQLFTELSALLSNIKPDILLLTGDRYETATAALAAAMLKIPIAHIGGGERTEGAIDDSLRHAITKLSYYHFVSCDLYAQRIIQMGEQPDRVFTVGAPGIDNLALPRMSREEIEVELGIELKYPIVLCAYHPETLGNTDIREVKHALPEFGTLVVSGANADMGGLKIKEGLGYLSSDVYYRKSYGQRLWSSLLHECDVIIGNSSCAIIEGMTLGKKIINIGDRQKGRYEDAVKLFTDNKYAFGVPGEVSPKIADKLLTLDIPETPRKPFYEYAA